MNQLRSSDLFRYKQYQQMKNRNFHQHKQKVKSIMNRSSQSIKQQCQKQLMLISKNNLSHQRAMKFKLQQKQRQINFVNSNFINRIYSNEKRREKLFQRQLDSSRTDVLKGKVMSHLNRKPTQKIPTTSRTIGDVKRGNSFMVRRINQVKSTISLRDFDREYSKHEERSSMISKFKIDATSFKFIPKNQIMLGKVNKFKGTVKSERSLINKRNSNCIDQQAGFITERMPTTFKQKINTKPRASQTLMKLNIPVKPMKPLGINIKLQQLKASQKKPQQQQQQQQQQSKYSTVMRLSHPQKSISSSLRKLRFNNF